MRERLLELISDHESTDVVRVAELLGRYAAEDVKVVDLVAEGRHVDTIRHSGEVGQRHRWLWGHQAEDLGELRGVGTVPEDGLEADEEIAGAGASACDRDRAYGATRVLEEPSDVEDVLGDLDESAAVMDRGGSSSSRLR